MRTLSKTILEILLEAGSDRHAIGDDDHDASSFRSMRRSRDAPRARATGVADRIDHRTAHRTL
jgi:hypothetical protein